MICLGFFDSDVSNDFSHLKSCDSSKSEKLSEIQLPLVLPSLHSVSLYCHTRVQSPLWLQLNLTLLLECLSHFLSFTNSLKLLRLFPEIKKSWGVEEKMRQLICYHDLLKKVIH